MTVKLRKPSEVPSENGSSPEAPQPIPLRPLAISGVLVSKSALIEGLRIYVPNLMDIDQLEDGRFLLSLAPGEGPAATG